MTGTDGYSALVRARTPVATGNQWAETFTERSLRNATSPGNAPGSGNHDREPREVRR